MENGNLFFACISCWVLLYLSNVNEYWTDVAYFNLFITPHSFRDCMFLVLFCLQIERNDTLTFTQGIFTFSLQMSCYFSKYLAIALHNFFCLTSVNFLLLWLFQGMIIVYHCLLSNFEIGFVLLSNCQLRLKSLVCPAI